jgi:DNA-binding NarL/FixJ family response regulator
MIQLIIVEDRADVLRVLQMRLTAEEDFWVIGEASDCETAVELARTLCPDAVLVDVDMLRLDGLEIVQELHKICPDTSVIVLSIHDDAITCARAVEAGATAFVAKSLPNEMLLATIRSVCQE